MHETIIDRNIVRGATGIADFVMEHDAYLRNGCTVDNAFHKIARELSLDEEGPLDDMLDNACRSATYYKVTPMSQEDIDIIVKWVEMHDGYFAEKPNDWYIGKDELRIGLTVIVVLYESVCALAYSRDRLERAAFRALLTFTT